MRALPGGPLRIVSRNRLRDSSLGIRIRTALPLYDEGGPRAPPADGCLNSGLAASEGAAPVGSHRQADVRCSVARSGWFRLRDSSLAAVDLGGCEDVIVKDTSQIRHRALRGQAPPAAGVSSDRSQPAAVSASRGALMGKTPRQASSPTGATWLWEGLVSVRRVEPKPSRRRQIKIAAVSAATAPCRLGVPVEPVLVSGPRGGGTAGLAPRRPQSCQLASGKPENGCTRSMTHHLSRRDSDNPAGPLSTRAHVGCGVHLLRRPALQSL